MGIYQYDHNMHLAYTYLDRITLISKKRQAIEFRNPTARLLLSYSDLLYPLTTGEQSLLTPEELLAVVKG